MLVQKNDPTVGRESKNMPLGERFPAFLENVTVQLPLTTASFQLGETSYTCKMASQLRAR